MMLLKHTMSANLTRPIKIKPDAMAILEPRWSDISPEEGTEACLCSWCSKMIGRDQNDPAWEDHIEYCAGCELCEIAVRLFEPHRNAPDKVLELRFHPKCFDQIIEHHPVTV